jgi:hypothetical protein
MILAVPIHLRVPRISILCAYGAVFLGLAGSARAQVSAWNDASGGAWETNTNWTPSGEPGTSDTVTITTAGTYTITLSSNDTIKSFVLNNSGTTLAISNSDLTLSENGGASAITAGTLTLSNVQIIATSGSGNYSFGNTGTIDSTANTNYIYGNSGVGTGMLFTNDGTINVTGGTLYLGHGSTDTVTNASGGTITVSAGGILNLQAGLTSIVNQGILQATGGGVINIFGPLVTADLGGTISDVGSTINLAGALSNLSQTLNPPTGGTYTLASGGSITGGTVASGAITFSNGGTLNDVTMLGNFSAPSGSTFTASNGTTFETGTTTFTGAIARVGAGSPGLTIASDETWTGSPSIYGVVTGASVLNDGQITSASGNNYFYGNGSTGFTFTNAGTVSITGGTLTMGSGATDAITNNLGGTIEVTGATLNFNGGAADSITNLGTIMATGGGIINFGGTYTTADLGGMIGESGVGSVLNISGSLNNASATLNVPTAGGIYTLDSSGTITGGTVASGAITFSNGGTLNDVTMLGNFNVPSGSTFTVSNGTTFETGTTTFTNATARVGAGSPGLTIASDETWTGSPSIYASVSGANALNDGQITNVSGNNYFYGAGSTGFTFTNAGTVSVTGGTLTMGSGGTDAITNNLGGTIDVTGATLNFNGGAANSITNLGTIMATGGGIINFGGTYTTADLGGMIGESGVGSVLNISGSLNNASATLNLPTAGGIYTLISGGTITGGTVASGAITFSNGGTLNDVAMVGNFNAPSGSRFTASNGTLFETGTTTFVNTIVGVGAGSPGLTIAADETWTGNFSIYGGIAGASVVNNGTLTNTSSTNYYYDAGYTGYSFTNNGTITATAGALTIGDGPADDIVNTGTIEALNGTNISVGTNGGSVSNSGTLEATGAGSVLTLGSGSDTWTNSPGAFITAANGGIVNLGGVFSTSDLTSGHIGESGVGSAMNITGSLNNTAATLNAPDNGGIFTLMSGGTITGGTVVSGALTFGNGGTLSGATLTGDFAAALNATFTATNGTLFQTGTTTFVDSILRVGAGSPGLTIAADETWTGNFSIYGGVAGASVVNNGTLTNTSGTNYFYDGGNSGFTFTNNGTITATAGALTIGDGVGDALVNTGLIEATNGTNLTLGASGGTVTNSGTLEATGAGSLLTLVSGSGTWTNSPGAFITAAAGGVVDLGGVYSTSDLTSGHIGESGVGSAMNIEGSLNNASATLNAPDNGGIFTLVSGGTITGGTVVTGALTFGNGGTLSGVTLTGNFAVPTSASFTASNGTLFQTGTTTFVDNVMRVGAGSPGLTIASDETWTGDFSIYGGVAGASIVNNGTLTNTSGTNYDYDGGNTGYSFTNNGTVTATAGTLTIGDGAADTLVNTGLIEAATGATMNLGQAGGSVTNNGTLEATGTGSILTLGSTGGTWVNSTGASIIAASGGTVNLAGSYSTSGLTSGTINGTGGFVDIAGSLNNASATLNGPDAGGAFTLVNGGAITGGAVSSGALAFGAGGTLSGVTLTGNFTGNSSGSFTAANGTLFQTGTTTFANDVVRVGAGSPGLTIASDETWTGNVSIYGAVASASVVNNGTIDLISGGNEFYGGGNTGYVFTNNGTIDVTTGSLVIANGSNDMATNSGTIEADAASVTLAASTATLTNFSGNTLSGGTWIASAGGSLTFPNTTNSIVTLGAATTLELSGTGSSVSSGPMNHPLEQTLTTNDGTLEVLANRNFASTSSGLTNNGIFQLGGGTLTAASLTNNPGSQLLGTGTFNPTGGVTIGGGVLVSPGSASANNYVGAMTFNSGTLGPGGTYTFDVANASGTAGTGYDTIAVSGTLNITATSISPFTINLESINPGTGLPGMATFNSSTSYQWTLLSATSVTGFNASDFALNAGSFTNSLGVGGFYFSSTGTDIFLNFTPVPEPSTWALIGVGVAAVGLVALRRRRARA